jgi:hypothetical protein
MPRQIEQVRDVKGPRHPNQRYGEIDTQAPHSPSMLHSLEVIDALPTPITPGPGATLCAKNKGMTMFTTGTSIRKAI